MTIDPVERDQRPHVVIIGGGFSGMLTAMHLAQDPLGPKVSLIERRDSVGPGAAYSTDNPEHLLNVRIGNMSAFPNRPNHFVEWLAQKDGWSVRSGFVTRGCFGQYLQDLLEAGVRGKDQDHITLVRDEVETLDMERGRWRVHLSTGESLQADAIVLATGHTPPAPLPTLDSELAVSDRYVADPWGSGTDLGKAGRNVLLVGAGLTMVDVALSLANDGRRLVAISRRGVLPQSHAVVTEPTRLGVLVGGPLSLFRRIRRESDVRDWRAVLDGVRPQVQTIWSGWSEEEKRQFLRHLRPWWDAHRHRMAPVVAQKIERLERYQDLVFRKGRIHSLRLMDNKVELLWSMRGDREVQSEVFDTVVNCTGPSGDLRQDRLLASLAVKGLVTPDRLGMGISVDQTSHIVDRQGAPVSGFMAVGPLTRGRFWEITSVPDIRVQATEVAKSVLLDFGTYREQEPHRRRAI